jgi:hypothetical protein
VVAKGFSQIEGINYNEIFALVAKYFSILMLLGISTMLDLEIHQMDVKITFFHGELNLRMFNGIVEGFEKPNYKEFVCKFKKAIYGLWQASQVWNKRIDSSMKQKGFK